MKKIKVVTVVGTRPEIIRLSRVINALNNNFNHTWHIRRRIYSNSAGFGQKIKFSLIFQLNFFLLQMM